MATPGGGTAIGNCGFVPAVVTDAEPLRRRPRPPAVEPVAITVEFSAGVRVIIDATAPAALVTATLRALQ